jgi:hypothetical protein
LSGLKGAKLVSSVFNSKSYNPGVVAALGANLNLKCYIPVAILKVSGLKLNTVEVVVYSTA